MKRKPLRLQKKGTSFWQHTVLVTVLFMGVSIGGVWYILFRSPLFFLNDLAIAGASGSSQEAYMETVKSLLNKQSFFPRNSILFIPAETISRSLVTAFPEIQSVTVERNLLYKRVVVRISEKEVIASLCEAQETCVAVDKEGIAIRAQNDRSASPLFLLTENRNFVLGMKEIEPSVLGTLLDFKKELEGRVLFKEQGLSIFSFSLVGSRKVDIRFSEGWVSFIDSKEDIEWQKEKLIQVLEKQIPKEKRKELEYIDVRFGDQAYVKYR